MVAFSVFPVTSCHISPLRWLPYRTNRRLKARSPFACPSRACRPYCASRGKRTLVCSYVNQNPPRSLFPGGYKRPEIRVPNVILRLSAEEVLRDDNSVLNVIDGAVSGRVGIVVLTGSDGSGKKLYEAACLLKSVIRDRAYLLIDERVDIAAAVNASGVLLSDQGLPAIVARNAMMDVGTDSVILPLVGRSVETQDAALEACGTEGADFIVITARDGRSEELALSVSERVKVPIFVMLDSLNGGISSNVDLLKSGISGLMLSLIEVNWLERDAFRRFFLNRSKVEDGIPSFENLDAVDIADGLPARKMFATSTELEARKEFLVEEERTILLEAINVIQNAAPLMGDVSLLKDAVSQLDEPFLLVIVVIVC